MKQLNIGIIGIGRFGRLHLQVLQQLPGCKIVAIADTDEELLKQLENVLKDCSTGYLGNSEGWVELKIERI